MKKESNTNRLFTLKDLFPQLYFRIIFSPIVIVVLLFGCQERDEKSPSDTKQDLTILKKPKYVSTPFPKYFLLPGLLLDRAGLVDDGLAIAGNLSGELAPYALYLVYQDILGEQGWEILSTLEEKGEYRIKAETKQEKVELFIRAADKRTGVYLIYAPEKY
jgi:hypothetical protein